MTRVAITGASGFIGQRLARECASFGHVLALDLRPWPGPAPANLQAVTLDITDLRQTAAELGAFRPQAVVHLAARTDTNSESIDDYSVNWLGTASIYEATAATGTAERFLHVSTQYVHALASPPVSDTDYSPFTAYGASKVRSEVYLREAADIHRLAWTIARPTNIWGPEHPRYPSEFWNILSRGLYAHPKLARSPRRAYGYVGNVSWQLRGLLESPLDQVSGRTLYVGDPLLDLDDWVDAFSMHLIGRPARRIPVTVLRSMARIGDLLNLIKLRAPLTTGRLRNMIEDSAAPMDEIHALLGQPPYDLESGVRETVNWLQDGTGSAH